VFVNKNTPKLDRLVEWQWNTSETKQVGLKSKQKCSEYATYSNEATCAISLSEEQNNIIPDKVQTIVGGKKAKPKEFPHMALVGYDHEGNGIEWNCGGSLISEKFVLTAAHCLNYFGIGDAKYVRVGDLVLNTDKDDARSQEFDIINKYGHPDYKPPSHYNDIGLLEIDGFVKFDYYVRPACLHTNSSLNIKNFIATGWGRTGYLSGTSKELLKVELVHFSHKICNDTYKSDTSRKLRSGIIDSIQICAGSALTGADTCQGDSGGPLQIDREESCTYSIVGITSFGRSCGIPNVPGVYTRVSHYIEWIEEIVWP